MKVPDGWCLNLWQIITVYTILKKKEHPQKEDNAGKIRFKLMKEF